METQEQLIESFIEVRLKEKDDFLKVLETLTRIGIASKHRPALCQSCHILHKRGKYYILHFKQLFMLDNKPTDFTESDRARLNTIANLLATWGLVELVNPGMCVEPLAPMSQVKVIPHADKKNWQLIQKYSIGNKKFTYNRDYDDEIPSGN